jgi:nucleoside transporter
MRMKLFIMMVIELFIWGAWLPLVWGYIGPLGLNFSGSEQAWIGSAFAIASVVGIFFSNQFADRNFSAERFMAFSHLIGGLAMLGLYFVTSFPAFFALMLLHSLFYVPTISVANALAFANLKDPQKEFGPVRMGGTIGWILAAWPLYFILGNKTGAEAIALYKYKYIFIISGVASLALAAFALTLPHTPPKPATGGAQKLAWVEAFKLLAIPYLLVLFIVTFVDATIHNGYFLMAGGFLSNPIGGPGFENKWIMPIMSIGQIAEILTMAVLGSVLKRFGWKTTMIMGILGHAVRFGVFAMFPESKALIIIVQVLHGICYAFFFATVYIFIDAAFPKDVRTSAQGLFNLLILGLGDLAAKWMFIPLQTNLTQNNITNYKSLFLVPTLMAIGAAIILALAFRPPREEVEAIGTPATAH